MSQQQETQRTFTQEEANAMYEALCQIENIAFTLTAEPVLDAMMEFTPFSEFGVLAVIKNVRDTLQALATPQATEPASQPASGRYVVREGQAPDTQMSFWCVTTEEIIEHVKSVHATEYEAEQAAAALNAGAEASGRIHKQGGWFVSGFSAINTALGKVYDYDTPEEAEQAVDRLNAGSTGQGGE